MTIPADNKLVGAPWQSDAVMMSRIPNGDEAVATMLVVDDNEALRTRLCQAFEQRGYAVRGAANYDEAVAAARGESPELAVVDMRMPGRSGVEVLKALKQIDPATKVVVLTGFGSIAGAVEAVRLGATNYIIKPANADEVLAAFEPRANGAPSPAATDFEPATLAQAEWDHINRVLAECAGNLSEAARLLGIHRRSLQRKLRKLAP